MLSIFLSWSFAFGGLIKPCNPIHQNGKEELLKHKPSLRGFWGIRSKICISGLIDDTDTTKLSELVHGHHFKGAILLVSDLGALYLSVGGMLRSIFTFSLNPVPGLILSP